MTLYVVFAALVGAAVAPAPPPLDQETITAAMADDENAPRPHDAGAETDAALAAALEADTLFRYANAAVAASAGAGLLTASGAFAGQQVLAAGADVEALSARLVAISLFGLAGAAGLLTLLAVAVDTALAAVQSPPSREAFTLGRDADPAPLRAPPGDLADAADAAMIKRWVLFAAGLSVGALFGGAGTALLVLGFNPDDKSGRINLPLVLSMSGAALLGAGVTAALTGLTAPFVLRSDAELLLDQAAE